MKIKLAVDFKFQLIDIIEFIANDKPFAAKKFKKQLLLAIKKNLINLYNFKKSIYFSLDIYRDYFFKGYTIICKIDSKSEIVFIIGITKFKNSL